MGIAIANEWLVTNYLITYIIIFNGNINRDREVTDSHSPKIKKDKCPAMLFKNIEN